MDTILLFSYVYVISDDLDIHPSYAQKNDVSTLEKEHHKIIKSAHVSTDAWRYVFLYVTLDAMAFLLEDPIALENAGQAGPCDWLGALRILASQKISGNNNFPPFFVGGVGGWDRGFFCFFVFCFCRFWM